MTRIRAKEEQEGFPAGLPSRPAMHSDGSTFAFADAIADFAESCRVFCRALSMLQTVKKKPG